MLASDLNNPEFAGPINPDSKLAVQFYSRPVRNQFRSDQEGRPIFEDRDYVKIFVPGDSTSVIDTPAREEHKRRFPLQWAHYQNQGGGRAEVGTPITQWPQISQSQAEELKALKFYTVESVAFASDQQLQAIGMKAGVAVTALRDRARNFLELAKDSSVVQRQAEDNKKLREQLAELQAQVEALAKDKAPKRKYTKKVKDGDDAPARPASL